MSTTEADDRRELELLRLANAELTAANNLQAARIEHLTRMNEHLAAESDKYRTGANVAVIMATHAEADRLAALEQVRQLAEWLKADQIVAEVDAVVARGDEAGDDTEYWLNTAGAFGFDPTDIAARNVKPLRAVPRQGGGPC